MLRITNGVITLDVTDGAYDEYYQYCGFEVVGSPERPEEREEVNTSPAPNSGHFEDSPQPKTDEDDSEEDEDELDEDEDLSEIPLSDMTTEQLKRYADELGLDYTGIKYKRELRSLIKDHLV